jgi:putative protease
MNLPELLAPAGSFESLAAAVSAGADAVYLGGKRFGARSYAENFDREKLKEAVSYSHLRNVRVYATVNTLVLDHEISEAVEFLQFLYETGVDAVLVQDLGVAAIARDIVPDLPLHASTQMTIYHPEGVAFAKKQGFRRVVLARELSLEEVTGIAGSPGCEGIGLEIFIHGALCYCYSGQCLLSSVIGGRSGNRGMCAQPCRKPYSFVTGPADPYGRPISLSPVSSRDRYLLSTKDLCSYLNLENIARAPVESLKIEGRMRSPRYVAKVVSIYRKALDAIKAGNWEPSERDEEELAIAFNRGFTAGYLGGERHRDLMGSDRPDNRGLLVGTVTSFHSQAREAFVQPSGTCIPGPGDGVVFHDPVTGKETGMIVSRSPGRTGELLAVRVPEKVRPGAYLYLTRRRQVSEETGLQFSGTGSDGQFIPVTISVTWDDRMCPVMSGEMKGKDGIPVIYRLKGASMTPALTSPLSCDQITRQLVRSGGTPFYIKKFSINYPGNLFAPVGVLNQFRRDFFSGAAEAILATWRPSREKTSIASARKDALVSSLTSRPSRAAGKNIFPMQISVYASEYAVAEEALLAGCDLVYFEPVNMAFSGADFCKPGQSQDFCRSSAWENSLLGIHQLATRVPGHVAWKWPAVIERWFTDPATAELPRLAESGLHAVMTGSPGLADKIRDIVPGMPVYGSPDLNVCNHISAGALSPLFKRLTISPEVSGKDITSMLSFFPKRTAGLEFEVLVQGNLEVLISRDCLSAAIFPGPGACGKRKDSLFYGISDDTGRVFPLWIDMGCRAHLGNSHETCLIDNVPFFMTLGLNAVSVDARHRTALYAREMVRLYREAMMRSCEGGEKKSFVDLIDSVKKISLGGITAAHFKGSPGLLTPDS